MIAMAIAMNAGGGDGRQQCRRHNLDGQQRWQRNGQWDSGAIAMAMGDGGEKATQWKTAMAAAQLQWAMVTAVQ